MTSLPSFSVYRQQASRYKISLPIKESVHFFYDIQFLSCLNMNHTFLNYWLQVTFRQNLYGTCTAEKIKASGIRQLPLVIIKANTITTNVRIADDQTG